MTENYRLTDVMHACSLPEKRHVIFPTDMSSCSHQRCDTSYQSQSQCISQNDCYCHSWWSWRYRWTRNERRKDISLSASTRLTYEFLCFLFSSIEEDGVKSWRSAQRGYWLKNRDSKIMCVGDNTQCCISGTLQQVRKLIPPPPQSRNLVTNTIRISKHKFIKSD